MYLISTGIDKTPKGNTQRILFKAMTCTCVYKRECAAIILEPAGYRPVRSLQHGGGLEMGPFISGAITIILINAYFVTSLDFRV